MKNKELQDYIQTQIVLAPKRLEGISRDAKGDPLFKRSVFFELREYADNFLKKGNEPRIIVMPGLRGTGKTTLLAQLFASLNGAARFYISVDEVIKRFNAGLWDIVENYEELSGQRIEETGAPMVFFFDEIHFDKKWAFFLKSVYDKSKNVMVFCTGSAALLLREQIAADVARRVFFVDINPVCFSEYMLFKYGKKPEKEIARDATEALLRSDDAQEVFEKLRKQENKIKKYWLDIDPLEVHRYIKFGTFPFTLNIGNESLAANFIAQIINKIIYSDIPQFYNFENETLNRIDRILYLISETLGVSVAKLSQTLEIKPDTLRLILKSLESAGLVLRVAPWGAHFRQVKKPSKYLFAAPALRFSYLSARESSGVFENYKGSLFEDLAGMYLNSILPRFGDYSLAYDVAEGGADFIVSSGKRKIVIEIGAGKKNYRQVGATAAKIKSNYSVVVSNDEIGFSKENNAVKISLKHFLLVQ